jgi:hypothetical protein
MHFMKAIAIFITRIFARRMIDRLVLIAPFFKARGNIVLVRVQQATRMNHLHQHWFDRYLLDVRQLRISTSPERCNRPKIGGFSSAKVPRPRFAFKRRRRPSPPTYLNSNNIKAIYQKFPIDRLFSERRVT